MRITNALVMLAGLAVASSTPAWAAGLDTLSDKNPEKAEEGGEAAAEEGGGEEGEAKPEKAAPPSEMSKSLAQKLFMGTSFGWVKASKSSGEWEGSGMSDLTVGYNITKIGSNMGIAGTYRYAPVAVSGVEDDQSYRGVWEAHYFGGMFKMNVSPTITAIGTGELGYVMVHMHSTDGLEPDTKVQAGGVSVNLGGGADFALADKGAWSAGPRLHLGFGSMTTIQVAGAATFLF